MIGDHPSPRQHVHHVRANLRHDQGKSLTETRTRAGDHWRRSDALAGHESGSHTPRPVIGSGSPTHVNALIGPGLPKHARSPMHAPLPIFPGPESSTRLCADARALRHGPASRSVQAKMPNSFPCRCHHRCLDRRPYPTQAPCPPRPCWLTGHVPDAAPFGRSHVVGSTPPPWHAPSPTAPSFRGTPRYHGTHSWRYRRYCLAGLNSWQAPTPTEPVFRSHASLPWHAFLLMLPELLTQAPGPTHAFTCSPPVLPVQASSGYRPAAGGAACEMDGRSRSGTEAEQRDDDDAGGSTSHARLLSLGLRRRGGNGQHPSTRGGQAIDDTGGGFWGPARRRHAGTTGRATGSPSGPRIMSVMDRRRLLLVLLLAICFDFACVAIPTPRGVVWDEDEEIVHLRRPLALPRRLAAADPVPATNLDEAAPRPVPALRPGGDRAGADRVQPRANLSAEPSAPTDDH